MLNVTNELVWIFTGRPRTWTRGQVVRTVSQNTMHGWTKKAKTRNEQEQNLDSWRKPKKEKKNALCWGRRPADCSGSKQSQAGWQCRAALLIMGSSPHSASCTPATFPQLCTRNSRFLRRNKKKIFKGHEELLDSKGQKGVRPLPPFHQFDTADATPHHRLSPSLEIPTLRDGRYSGKGYFPLTSPTYQGMLRTWLRNMPSSLEIPNLRDTRYLGKKYHPHPPSPTYPGMLRR